MFAVIKSFLAPYWLSIAKWGGIAASVLFVLLKARQSGKDAVISGQQSETIKNVSKAHEVQRKVNAMPISDVDKRLQKWRRD